MERMSPLDAMFLHLEHGVRHMHISPRAIGVRLASPSP